MRFSVIIATFNRCHLLRQVLQTLLEQTFPPEDFEIIVVVDGSTDGTLEMLKGYAANGRIRVLKQPNLGTAAAENSGIAVAAGELLLIINDDCLCDPGLLDAHDAAHRGSAPAIVIGPVLAVPPKTPGILADLNQRFSDANWERSNKERPGFRDAMLCANSSVPKRVFEQCGTFDERFRRLHDVEFGLRLWKAGVRVKFEFGAVARQISVKTAAHLVQREEPTNASCEWLLYRTHPQHKTNSRLALWNSGSLAKRLCRKLFARLPFSPEPILSRAYWVAERAEKLAPARRIGISLLQTRLAIAFWQSALKEAGSAQVLQDEFGLRIPALAYHHIGVARPGSYPSLTTPLERFRKQVQWLARQGFTGISASDWLRWREGQGKLPAKPILLTFDDAYEETALNAFPVLEQSGFRATAFVVTSLMGKTNRWDERQGRPSLRLADPDLIRHWAKRGIEFGAHSRTHQVLPGLTDAELEAEVAGSAADLRAILGRPASAFAYPYDQHDGRVRQCVGNWFDLAFRGSDSLNSLQTDCLSLCRSEVQPTDSYLDIRFRLTLGWHPIERAYQHWAKRKR